MTPFDAGKDIDLRVAGDELEEGLQIVRPQDRFPMWGQIYSAVQDEFRRRSKDEKDGHHRLMGEQEYFKLVNSVIDGRPELGVSPIALSELVVLLRKHQFGYGGIEDYLQLEGIEEVYFNRFDDGFYKRGGKKHRIDPPLFSSEKEMRDLIDRIAGENRLSIDLAHPVLDARLKDGSRLNAVIPPIARKGTSLVIRKHRDIPLTMADYLRSGFITEECAHDLERLVRGGMRIIVSGGTASGKTTSLNVIGNAFIPKDERLIVCEDTPELQIETYDTEYLVTQKDASRDIKDEGDITISDLIRYCLRMRPDRIIVGEVRGREAMDVLTAWNSGHEGSFLTLHANSAMDALSKFEQLAMAARVFTQEGVRDLIGRVVNIVIQVEEVKRGPKRGQRRVREMVQVVHPGNIAPEQQEAIDQMIADGRLKPMWDGTCYALSLYRLDAAQELTKVADPLSFFGQELD
jgi:Flp pilus assembly CpaF family ATPase